MGARNPTPLPTRIATPKCDPLDIRLGEPQSRTRHLKKICSPLQGMEPRILGCPARSVEQSHPASIIMLVNLLYYEMGFILDCCMSAEVVFPRSGYVRRCSDSGLLPWLSTLTLRLKALNFAIDRVSHLRRQTVIFPLFKMFFPKRNNSKSLFITICERLEEWKQNCKAQATKQLFVSHHSE